MLLECLDNDCYYKWLLLRFFKHCFLPLCFHLQWKFWMPLSYRKVNVSVKISVKPTKAFFSNRRTVNMFSFNSSFIWSIASERKKKKRRLKDGSIFAREVWKLVLVWVSYSCLKTCINMNHLWFIFHPKTTRQSAAVCYSHVAEVPLIHAHKSGFSSSGTQPVKGVCGNKITDCSRYLITPSWAKSEHWIKPCLAGGLHGWRWVLIDPFTAVLFSTGAGKAWNLMASNFFFLQLWEIHFTGLDVTS